MNATQIRRIGFVSETMWRSSAKEQDMCHTFIYQFAPRAIRSRNHLKGTIPRAIVMRRVLPVFLCLAIFAWPTNPVQAGGGSRAVVVAPNTSGTEVPIAPNEKVGAITIVEIPGAAVPVIRIDQMPVKPDFNIITPNGASHPFTNGQYTPGVSVTWTSVCVHNPDGTTQWCVTGTFRQDGVGTVGQASETFPPGSERVPDPPQPPGLVMTCPDAIPTEPYVEALILAHLGMPDNPETEVWYVPSCEFWFSHPAAELPELVMIEPVVPPTIEKRIVKPELPIAPSAAPWQDRFDTYALDSGLHGQGGWKGWGNDLAFDAFVSDVQAHSVPHSAEIAGDADLVHEYDCTAGRWAYTAWQYIPSDFVGGGGDPAGSFFIIMNTYSDSGPYEEQDWSLQMNFDSNDGMLKVYYGNGMNTVDVPYLPDEWVEIEIVIDLDIDLTEVYYAGDLIVDYPWTAGVTGVGGGALNIGAVDLYANGSSPIYYDNLMLRQLSP